MKAFIDTNVLIDFLAERHPHYQASAILFELAANKKLEIVYSSISVANAFYILRKHYSCTQLSDVFEAQRCIAQICGVSSNNTYDAIKEHRDDGEDSIQHQSAISANCNVILTRNIKDFSRSTLSVMSPEEFLDKYFDNL